MSDYQTAEQIKQLLLNYRSEDDDLISFGGPCYSLSWKKDGWIVKENNKKIGEIEPKMLPKGFDIKSSTFISDALAILRKSNMEGLTKYLKALKKGNKEQE